MATSRGEAGEVVPMLSSHPSSSADVSLRRGASPSRHPTPPPRDRSRSPRSRTASGPGSGSVRRAANQSQNHFLPTVEPARHAQARLGERRLVVVGDVHGCIDELMELMRVVNFDRTKDLAVSVGDLVRKGPKTLEVLSFVRDHGFLAVRGNHEEKLLKLRQKFNAGQLDEFHEDYGLVASLRLEDLTWIEELPYSLDLVDRNILVVHAGLNNDKSIFEHSRLELTEMRSIVGGHAGKQGRLRDRWAKLYDGRNSSGRHVVFGHDAHAGLQVEALATGIDTGCVYGRHLTALVVGPDGSREFVRVAARCEYAKSAGKTADMDVAEIPSPRLRTSVELKSPRPVPIMQLGGVRSKAELSASMLRISQLLNDVDFDESSSDEGEL